MAEVLEKPERTRRPNARLLVVHHDRRRSLDAVHGQHVLDHPHEGLQRRGIGIDQAHAPQVDVDRAGDVPRGIRLGWPQIEQQRRRGARAVEDRRQLVGTHDEVRIRVALHNRESYYFSSFQVDRQVVRNAYRSRNSTANA